MIATICLGACLVSQGPLDQQNPFGKISSWMISTKTPKMSDFKGKVLIVHHGPTYCCGWDAMLGKVRKELDRWGSKVAAVSIVTYPMDEEGKKEFASARERVKITWPVGVDPDQKFTKDFFPGDMLHYTFTLFDKNGKRVVRQLDRIDDLSAQVEKLVKAPN